MSPATRMALVAAACAVAVCGCKTSEATGVRVDGPVVRDPGPSGTRTAAATPGDGQPQISAKARLAFEDAVKAMEEQKKKKALDYPQLEKRFRAAADADSSFAEPVYNLGVLAERQGKTKEAAEHYKAALARKPTLHQAAENLAVIAQNQGDEKGAIEIYENILANYPDDASSRARLGEIARRRGETDKAMELARAALFRDPKTAQAYKTMMLVSFEQKQYSMTRLIALRAARLDDSDPEIPYTLGLINLAEKDGLKARAQFKKAVELRADFLPAHHQLVKMAFDHEDYAGAEEHLRRILQANGSNPEALVNLGVAYKGMGQYDKAMAAYDAAQKLKPEIPELYLNRGTIIGIKGDPEKAITYFKQYLTLKSGADDKHPVHGLIKDQEAVIQKREDDKKKAEEDKKAIEEAARMEEEMKKQEAAAAEEEKKKKEEELKKVQSEAKGNAAKDALKDEPKPEGEKKPEEKKPPEEKKGDKKPPEAKKDDKKPAPAPAPVPAAPAPKKDEKKPAGDEPADAL